MRSSELNPGGGVASNTLADRAGELHIRLNQSMPIRYSIDNQKGCILEEWEGAISINDLEAYWTSYLADPKVLEIRRTIVDLRNARIEFKGDELDNLVQRLVIPKLNGLHWKTALIVSHPVQFGVARQYHVFADRYSRDAIFSDPTAAEEWLLNQ
jgi:hypothetical protein